MKLYILAIIHRHGTNYHAHKTYEGAMKSVEDYCDEWWGEWSFGQIEKPSDKAKLVEEYFVNAEAEWFDIEAVELGE